MKLFLMLFFYFTTTSLLMFGAKPKQELSQIIDKTLTFAVDQSLLMYKSLENSDGLLPRTSENNELVTCKANWWTSGFFPGALWYLYEYGQDTTVRQAAEAMTERVLGQQFTTRNHDVGFIINCSAGNGYRLTGCDSYRTAIINAGNSLSTRFNPGVGLIKSWDHRKEWQYPVIIDNMMNLELLMVSSSLTGNKSHYNIAESHADKTLVNHFRPNSSSYHLVDYDPATGRVLSQVTHQGYRDDSAWARGQAWGLYGYIMMYRQTRKQEYLNHAIKIGNFIANHPRLPKDKIPYWDFDAPKIPNTSRDASAGAVMASAFIELSTYVSDDLSEKFLRLGETQIESLASSAYRAKLGGNANFILMRSVGHMSRNSEVDVPLSYADYYFVEAMIRWKRLNSDKLVIDNQCFIVR